MRWRGVSFGNGEEVEGGRDVNEEGVEGVRMERLKAGGERGEGRKDGGWSREEGALIEERRGKTVGLRTSVMGEVQVLEKRGGFWSNNSMEEDGLEAGR